MALIKCSECGKEFSDKANACPNCSCPVEKQGNKLEEMKKRFKGRDYKHLTKAEKQEINMMMKKENVYPNVWVVLNAICGLFTFIFMFLIMFNPLLYFLAFIISFVLTFAFYKFAIQEINNYFNNNFK